jgi:hypothetical protein
MEVSVCLSEDAAPPRAVAEEEDVSGRVGCTQPPAVEIEMLQNHDAAATNQ